MQQQRLVQKAVACILQVMYDASGVRLHAGRQASVLNMIITELPPDHPVSDTRPLRDSLGHTPLQARLHRRNFSHGSWQGNNCLIGFAARNEARLHLTILEGVLLL